MSIQKTTDSSSLAEVIDRILDKGIVIDAFARVSLVGIEILTVEARVVIASVDTGCAMLKQSASSAMRSKKKDFRNRIMNETNNQHLMSNGTG